MVSSFPSWLRLHLLPVPVLFLRVAWLLVFFFCLLGWGLFSSHDLPAEGKASLKVFLDFFSAFVFLMTMMTWEAEMMSTPRKDDETLVFSKASKKREKKNHFLPL